MILITLLTSGCFGDRADYPVGFPPLAGTEPGKCPDISGQFSNLKQYSNGPDGQLSYFLWYGEEDKSHHKADRVMVTQPDPDEIDFIAPLEGGRSTRRSLNRNDNGFSCSNGFLVISTPKDAGTAVGAPVVAATWDWEELRLAKTSYGSLAIEHVKKGFALVNLVVPMGFAESIWFLYPATPEAPVKQPSPSP